VPPIPRAPRRLTLNPQLAIRVETERSEIVDARKTTDWTASRIDARVIDEEAMASAGRMAGPL
jgi:hypothetical protein